MSLRGNTILGCILLVTVSWGCAAPKRSDHRCDFHGKSYDQYAKDRYECLDRHDRLTYFVACMEARGYRHVGG